MASHWSKHTANVSGKQAYALDKIADDLGLSSGLSVLMQVTGASSSKTQRIMADYPAARRIIDAAFALGRTARQDA